MPEIRAYEYIWDKNIFDKSLENFALTLHKPAMGARLDSVGIISEILKESKGLNLGSPSKEKLHTTQSSYTIIAKNKWPPLRTEYEVGFHEELLFSETDVFSPTLIERRITPEAEALDGHSLLPAQMRTLKENAITIEGQKISSQRPSLAIARKTSAIADTPFVRKKKGDSVYRQAVRNQLLTTWNGEYGYQDRDGYIVDYYINGTSTTLGEGTLHTAIAVIAIATGNYNQDTWEQSNANSKLSVLFDTLTEKSWGNQDGFGRKHPIRHPNVHDYNASGQQLRNSPLTKDSFGAIVASCYYAYNCDYSSQLIQDKAKNLIQKWINYLVFNQWRLHSSTHPSYIEGEFESDGDYYANIFSGPNQERKDYNGPESFILLPHEIYALKRIGAHFELSTFQILPWTTSIPVALQQTILDVAAPYLADAAARTLSSILSLLTIKIPYSIDFGGSASWRFGIMKGEFVIDILPADKQREITDAFRNIITDTIREYFRLLFLGQNQSVDLLGLAVNRILDRMPGTLERESWRSVLMSAVQELASWLSNMGWIEAASFIGSLEFIKSMNKPDVTSYTLWSFAAECETSPEMYFLLKPFLLGFWTFIHSNNNPNGLWAWLSSEDTDCIDQQLALFESNLLDRWSEFAYGSTAFNEWATRPQDPDKKSPRLDYLVLDGLAEKGAPISVPEISGDWWNQFTETARQASDNFVALIKAEFTSSGRYMRGFIDAAGNRWHELWEAEGKYTRELFINTQRVEQLFSRLNGEVEKYLWNREGVFTNYFKWQRLLPDGTVSIEDLVEMRVRSIQGQLEKITWSSTHSFESFKKWCRSTAEGGADAADMIERRLRDPSGVLTQVTWSTSNVFESFRKWWRSTAEGEVDAADMVERQLRDPSGVLTQVTWSTSNVFESFRKWWRSTAEGGVDIADMVERQLRDPSGVLTQVTWSTSNVFKSFGKWWRSTVEGGVDAVDMVEKQLRDPSGVLTQVVWSTSNVFESFRKWWQSTAEGGVDIADMVERQLRDPSGVLTQVTWSTSNVFESFGKWWRSTAEGGADAADMIERQSRDPSGVLTQITWSTSHVFESFRKWWQSTAEGEVTVADMVERHLRDPSGVLTQVTWSTSNVFESFRKWWRSTAEGGADAADMIEKQLRDPSGVLTQVTWFTSSVFESLRKWWRSTLEGRADAADMIERQLRDPSGVLTQVTWSTSNVFESFGKWWRSTPDGFAADIDIVERKLRDSGGELQKWIWGEDSIFQKYRLWIQSNVDGSASGENLRKEFTQVTNDYRVVEIWDDAGQYSRSVFDSIGRLIEGINIPMPDWPPPWL